MLSFASPVVGKKNANSSSRCSHGFSHADTWCLATRGGKTFPPLWTLFPVGTEIALLSQCPSLCCPSGGGKWQSCSHNQTLLSAHPGPREVLAPEGVLSPKLRGISTARLRDSWSGKPDSFLHGPCKDSNSTPVRMAHSNHLEFQDQDEIRLWLEIILD